MSLLSTVVRPASGLQNASMGQKLDCTNDKMKSGFKFALAQGVTAGAGTAGVLAALKCDKFSSAVSKVTDKAASKLGITTIFSKIVDAAKKNPKTAKAFAAIALATSAISATISMLDLHNNGKIEGKHQERADFANRIKKEA